MFAFAHGNLHLLHIQLGEAKEHLHFKESLCRKGQLCNTEANEAVLAKLSRDYPPQQGRQPRGQHTVKGKEEKIFLF